MRLNRYYVSTNITYYATIELGTNVFFSLLFRPREIRKKTETNELFNIWQLSQMTVNKINGKTVAERVFAEILDATTV